MRNRNEKIQYCPTLLRPIMSALMEMKKFDLAGLERAFKGQPAHT